MTMLKTLDLSQSLSLETNVSPNMDPRLQYYVACQRAGIVRPASNATSVDEISVIARVSNTKSWINLSEVREPIIIGKNSKNEYIVTGRIPIKRIENVRSQKYVNSLKAPQKILPMLNATVTETSASPSQLPNGHLSNGGEGVVVGVIDYGMDFAHRNFLHGSNTSRLVTLWDQNGQTTPTSPFGYGREYTNQDLNFALSQNDPYQAIGYDPAWYDPRNSGSHGTHVMDIAAGNGLGSGVAGMAPNASLVFVNISHALDPQNENVVGESFGDSVRLLEALKYIFDKAGTKPCVVNISLGTNGGPHDGTTLVEQGIDSLVSQAPNRAVTISAANSYDDGIHASGVLSDGDTFDLHWQLQPLSRADIEMEIWYPHSDRFSIELIAPNGNSLVTVLPGGSETLRANGNVAVFVANRLNDPNNQDNMIGIFLSQGMPGGTYTVRLHGDQITDGNFHAWIERDNFFQSRFVPPHDNSLTIGSVSCGQLSIAVGSYDAHKTSKPLSFFSSAGPTRDGRLKPEVSAPGHAVLAAKSSTETGTVNKSGTSMASPAVAGMIALMFGEAIKRNVDLSIDQTRDILIKTSRKNPPFGGGWHPRFGYGRILASEALEEVIKLANNAPSGTSHSKKKTRSIKSRKSTKRSINKKSGKPRATKKKPITKKTSKKRTRKKS